MSDIVVVAIIGLISGSIGSLVAPWAQFGVEKYKLRLENRKKFIDNCREEIQKDEFDIVEFINTPLYSQLRVELAQNLREELSKVSSDKVVIQLGGRGEGANNYKPKLLDELAYIENKWKLL